MIRETIDGINTYPVRTIEDLRRETAFIPLQAVIRTGFGYLYQDTFGNWRDTDGALPRGWNTPASHPVTKVVIISPEKGDIFLEGVPELSPEDETLFGPDWKKAVGNLTGPEEPDHELHPENLNPHVREELVRRGILDLETYKVLIPALPAGTSIHTTGSGRKYKLVESGEFIPGEYPKGGIHMTAWEPRLNDGKGMWTYVDNSPDMETAMRCLRLPQTPETP